jgi:hypothetical protein
MTFTTCMRNFDGYASGSSIPGVRGPPDLRRQPHEIKEIWRDPHTTQNLGSLRTRVHQPGPHRPYDVFEHRRVVPVINKFVRGERASDKTCFKVLDEHVHQAIGVGVWKWCEQNVVDDAVDDRDRANAKRERQDRGCREARRAGQRANRVAYVSLEIFEPDERSRVALLFVVCSTRPNARRAAVRISQTSSLGPGSRLPAARDGRLSLDPAAVQRLLGV